MTVTLAETNQVQLDVAAPLIALIVIVCCVVAIILVVCAAMALAWWQERRERRTRKDVCPSCEGYRYVLSYDDKAGHRRGVRIQDYDPIKGVPDARNEGGSVHMALETCGTCGGAGEIPVRAAAARKPPAKGTAAAVAVLTLATLLGGPSLAAQQTPPSPPGPPPTSAPAPAAPLSIFGATTWIGAHGSLTPGIALPLASWPSLFRHLGAGEFVALVGRGDTGLEVGIGLGHCFCDARLDLGTISMRPAVGVGYVVPYGESCGAGAAGAGSTIAAATTTATTTARVGTCKTGIAAGRFVAFVTLPMSTRGGEQ